MPVHAGGDLEAGRAKSAVCAGCHGFAGVTTNPAWPNLAGQNYKYLVKRLKDFRDGEREDDVMTAMAKPLSDQDIENLATYFTSLPLRAAGDP
jgi:cytochrome c553